MIDLAELDRLANEENARRQADGDVVRQELASAPIPPATANVDAPTSAVLPTRSPEPLVSPDEHGVIWPDEPPAVEPETIGGVLLDTDDSVWPEPQEAPKKPARKKAKADEDWPKDPS